MATGIRNAVIWMTAQVQLVWHMFVRIAWGESGKRMTKDLVRDELTQEVDALRAALTMLRERVAELEQLADSDTLTPLANRRSFMRELQRTIAAVARHDEPAAVLFIDLNGLKKVNDSHGHKAGDAILLHVARELRAHVRLTDSVARIGGDEFAVILNRVDAEGADAKAKSLAQHLSETYVDIGTAVLPVGISCGVADVRANDDVDSVLARADAAMYAQRRLKR